MSASESWHRDLVWDRSGDLPLPANGLQRHQVRVERERQGRLGLRLGVSEDEDYTVAPSEPVIVAVDAGGGDADKRSVTGIVATTRDLRVTFVKKIDAPTACSRSSRRSTSSTETHPIEEIVYDRWGMASEALRNADRYRLVQFQMNGQRQVQASEALIQAVIAGRFRHPGHPDLDAHSSHATTETTPLGQRIVRAHREPIDLIACLTLCAVRGQQPRKRFCVFTPD